jgi:hypothetical protein
MKITKIHVKEDRVKIEYQTRFTKGDEIKVNKFAVDCCEAARPEFYKVLQSLREDMIEICELPEDFSQGLSIVGATFNHDDDIWGALISGLKTLKKSRAPFIIHTPYKPAVPDTGDSNRISCLSNSCVAKLDKLMEYAEGYVDGKRAQVDAFSQPESNPKRLRLARGERFEFPPPPPPPPPESDSSVLMNGKRPRRAPIKGDIDVNGGIKTGR